MRLLALIACFAGLFGCATPAQRIDALAESMGLSRTEIEGDGHRHTIYMNGAMAGQTGGTLILFLEGDGSPWGANGQIPAADPTPHNPLALRLLARTALPAAYIGRPCYHDQRDPACSVELWTGGRYSPEVIDSMSAAARSVIANAAPEELVIVGYSGGGALAVLLAERLEAVGTVITIAANLDIDAWTQHHSYLPLAGSLNPARSHHAHPWREIHLLGARDTTVPPETIQRYFELYPHATRRTFNDYDHVCCWVDAWPALLQNILTAAK